MALSRGILRRMHKLLPTTDAQLLAQRAGLGVVAQLRRWPLRSAAAAVALLVQLVLLGVTLHQGDASVAAMALLLAAVALAVLLPGGWLGALGQGLLHARGVYTRSAARRITASATAAAQRVRQLADRGYITAAPMARARAHTARAACLIRLGIISTSLSRLLPAPRLAPGNLARA